MAPGSKNGIAVLGDTIMLMTLKWLRLSEDADGGKFTTTFRAKVPGGWLVLIEQTDASGIAFYPDPRHEWNGGSLP
jgi:hypothetical protein